MVGLDGPARVSLERDVVAEWDALTDDGALILEVDMVRATARKSRSWVRRPAAIPISAGASRLVTSPQRCGALAGDRQRD